MAEALFEAVEFGPTVDEFGLTVDDVADSRRFHLANLEAAKKLLGDPDMAEHARQSFEISKSALLLYEQGDEYVLDLARYTFDFSRMLKAMALTDDYAAAKLCKYLPEIPALYMLLRKRDWGYRLGQMVFTQITINSGKEYLGQIVPVKDMVAAGETEGLAKAV